MGVKGDHCPTSSPLPCFLLVYNMPTDSEIWAVSLRVLPAATSKDDWIRYDPLLLRACIRG